jgi:hypothetical protein
MITAPATLATAVGVGSTGGPFGTLVAVGIVLVTTVVRFASKTKSTDVDEIQTPSTDTSVDESEDDNRAGLPPDTGSRLALDPFHGRNGGIVIIQPPTSESCTPKPSISAASTQETAKDSWQDDATILTLSLAWALDTFMEIQVRNWREVMKNPERSEGHDWFHGTNLNRSNVNEVIRTELVKQRISARTVHDHLTAALDTISSQWFAAGRLKKGEMKAARRTLHGLISATLRAATTDADNHETFDYLIVSPQRTITFLDSRFPWPPGLSAEQLKVLLNQHWEDFG